MLHIIWYIPILSEQSLCFKINSFFIFFTYFLTFHCLRCKKSIRRFRTYMQHYFVIDTNPIYMVKINVTHIMASTTISKLSFWNYIWEGPLRNEGMWGARRRWVVSIFLQLYNIGRYIYTEKKNSLNQSKFLWIKEIFSSRAIGEIFLWINDNISLNESNTSSDENNISLF